MWKVLLYNCSISCGSPTQWLYDGINGDLLQEDLCHRLHLLGLLQPEPLSPQQATADLSLHRRHSFTQRQVWLSLLWHLWVLPCTRFYLSPPSISGVYGFNSKHDFVPPTTSCEELTHCKRPWWWEGLGAGEEGDDRGWDGWMASLTQWTWVWVNSRSWWWTGRPGMPQLMGSQRVGHDWETELNWTILLGLLLKPWTWGIFFWWGPTFSYQWLFSSELQFWSSHRRWAHILLLHHLENPPEWDFAPLHTNCVSHVCKRFSPVWITWNLGSRWISSLKAMR